MKLDIVDATEIGKRLHVARQRRQLAAWQVIKDVFGKAQGSRLTRWENGREGKCREVALVGAYLGLDPNQLLLRDPVAPKELSEESQAELDVLFIELRRMAMLMGDPSAPVRELGNFIAELNKKWEADDRMLLIERQKDTTAFTLPKDHEPEPVKKLSSAKSIAKKLKRKRGG